MGGEEIPFTAIAVVFGLLQIQSTYAGHLFGKYVHDFSWLVGKGNRLKMWELIAVVVGFSIDDIGTAIGQQAEEYPRQLYEGNPYMVNIWEWLIASGLARSTTDAHRIIYIAFMVQLAVNQYFGLMNPYGRLYYLYNAAMKTYSGYIWWEATPNRYTIMDFLTFQSGERRLERMSYGKLAEFNRMRAFTSAQMQFDRRRLVEEEVFVPMNSADWLTTYLPVMFSGSI